MALSAICKPIGMLLSIIYTPLLLSYLGEESYGVWSTILSVINWINYFDVGIGQGLRNTLTRYITNKDKTRAQKAVTTSYVILSAIAVTLLILGWLLIFIFDMNKFFNTGINIRPVLLVSFTGISITFVVSLSKTLLYATQQAEKVGYITLAIQVVNLIGIVLLSATTESNILLVAIVIALSGILVNSTFSIGVWVKYKYLQPRKGYFDRTEIKTICSIGIKFLIIQIAALILYSTDNMIITQLFGPSKVTPYSTSYTALGAINGIFVALISPLWSRITVAVEQKDYQWIRNIIIKLDLMLPLMAIVLALIAVFFEPISRIWLGKRLIFDNGLIVCMALYYLLTIWSSIYATAMNGMGLINIELVLGTLMAVVNIPLSIFLGKECKMMTTGVCLATDICMLLTAVIYTIYVHRVLKDRIHMRYRD